MAMTCGSALHLPFQLVEHSVLAHWEAHHPPGRFFQGLSGSGAFTRSTRAWPQGTVVVASAAIKQLPRITPVKPNIIRFTTGNGDSRESLIIDADGVSELFCLTGSSRSSEATTTPESPRSIRDMPMVTQVSLRVMA